MTTRRRTLVRNVLLGAAGAFLLAQAVPYGHTYDNPPVVREPAWDTPETRALAVRACFDCHSNETRWPWYARVAPVSWLVARDVNEGRRKLNFSEAHLPQRKAADSAREVRRGDMPLWFYLPTHPEARLSPAEKTALADSFARMFGEPTSGH